MLARLENHGRRLIWQPHREAAAVGSPSRSRKLGVLMGDVAVESTGCVEHVRRPCGLVAIAFGDRAYDRVVLGMPVGETALLAQLPRTERVEAGAHRHLLFGK